MNEISLASLFSVIRKQIAYILLVAILSGVLAGLYCTLLATPTYQATGSFLTSNGGLGSTEEDTISVVSTTKETTIKNTDVVASLALINTYIGILQTSGLYQETAKALDLNYSAGKLRSMIQVNAGSKDSLFVNVVVTSTNPEHSKVILNAYMECAQKYVVNMLPNSNIQIAERASGAVQNYPRTALTVVVFAFLGALVVIIIALIVSLADKTIKGDEDFRAHYDISVLGTVPNFNAAVKEERRA